jgi:hypothetical protein
MTNTSKQTFSLARRGDGWHVVDHEGYDVSYVSYETRKEALHSLKVLQEETATSGDTP